MFYVMGRVGSRWKRPRGDFAVLEPCAVPLPAALRQSADFLASHRSDGYVAYYFARGASPPGPCGGPWKPVFRQRRSQGCLALYRARDVSAPLPLQ